MNTELPHELAQYKAPLDTLQAVQAVALPTFEKRRMTQSSNSFAAIRLLICNHLLRRLPKKALPEVLHPRSGELIHCRIYGKRAFGSSHTEIRTSGKGD